MADFYAGDFGWEVERWLQSNKTDSIFRLQYVLHSRGSTEQRGICHIIKEDNSPFCSHFVTFFSVLLR